MVMKAGMVRYTFDISEEDHRRLKAKAALLGVSMRSFLMDFISKQLNSEDETTKKELELAKRG